MGLTMRIGYFGMKLIVFVHVFCVEGYYGLAIVQTY